MKNFARIQSNKKVIKRGGCGFFNKDIYAVRVLWCYGQCKKNDRSENLTINIKKES